LESLNQSFVLHESDKIVWQMMIDYRWDWLAVLKRQVSSTFVDYNQS